MDKDIISLCFILIVGIIAFVAVEIEFKIRIKEHEENIRRLEENDKKRNPFVGHIENREGQ